MHDAEREHLLRKLADSEKARRRWRVRLAAVRALTFIAPYNDSAVAALASAVSSEDSGVRQTATVSLLCLGPQAKPASPLLKAALHHEDKAVREAAAETLKEIEAELAREGGVR